MKPEKLKIMSKKYIYMLMGILFFTISCSERDDSIEYLSGTLQEGSWRVTTFDYMDRESSGYYKDYQFTFTVQNTVTAAGVNFYSGKWWVKKEGEHLILIMDFTHITPIQYLNYDWTVVSYDNQTISLSWDNPYYGGTDYLIFEKI
jgi:hypothetical protein